MEEITNPTTQTTQLQIINGSEALQAIEKAEVDSLVATAKMYPRNISNVINEVRTLATLDQDIATSCFYCLSRQGKLIEGPSVRFSEIIRASYGNISVASRIISNDGKFITAQGVCIDYEKNNRCSSEVKVRITGKDGRTYNDDMQTVAGNAACAKAERNAVFKVVPMAIFKHIMDEVKQVSVGNAADLATTRSKIIDWFAHIGVTQQMLFDYLGIGKIEEIDTDMVAQLRGLSTALKDNMTTVEETFIIPARQKAEDEAAKKNANTAAEKAREAARRSKPNDTAPKPEDTKEKSAPEQNDLPFD